MVHTKEQKGNKKRFVCELESEEKHKLVFKRQRFEKEKRSNIDELENKISAYIINAYSSYHQERIFYRIILYFFTPNSY